MSNVLEAKAIPEDVMQAAREAASKVWGSDTGSEELTAEFRRGMRDDSGSVQTAVVAILAERQRIVTALKGEADLTPCSEDAMVTRSNARLIEADFSYEEAERLAEKEEAEANG